MITLPRLPWISKLANLRRLCKLNTPMTFAIPESTWSSRPFSRAIVILPPRVSRAGSYGGPLQSSFAVTVPLPPSTAFGLPQCAITPPRSLISALRSSKIASLLPWASTDHSPEPLVIASAFVMTKFWMEILLGVLRVLMTTAPGLNWLIDSWSITRSSSGIEFRGTVLAGAWVADLPPTSDRLGLDSGTFNRLNFPLTRSNPGRSIYWTCPSRRGDLAWICQIPFTNFAFRVRLGHCRLSATAFRTWAVNVFKPSVFVSPFGISGIGFCGEVLLFTTFG